MEQLDLQRQSASFFSAEIVKVVSRFGLIEHATEFIDDTF
jgi:hypothetical protein